MEKFEGLIAAPFAPMNARGEILYDRIEPYCRFLEKNKVVGAFINGSTGEGVSLTTAERMKIAEQWAEAAGPGRKITVINLVGGTSQKECIELARHSAACGVDAVAVLGPYYFKPAGALPLAEFCARVAEAVPDLPFYFYHIPVLSGCYVPMFDFLKEAAPRIPNLAGIKYTHEDFMDFLSCVHFMEGKFDLLWGRDENLLSALILGTRAGVGSTYNYAAPLYYRMIAAYDAGEFARARRLQQQSIDMIRLLGKYGGIATGKAFMRYIGFDFGGFRPPVKNLSEEAYASFAADVRGLGMEDLFSKR